MYKFIVLNKWNFLEQRSPLKRDRFLRYCTKSCQCCGTVCHSLRLCMCMCLCVSAVYIGTSNVFLSTNTNASTANTRHELTFFQFNGHAEFYIKKKSFAYFALFCCAFLLIVTSTVQRWFSYGLLSSNCTCFGNSKKFRKQRHLKWIFSYRCSQRLCANCHLILLLSHNFERIVVVSFFYFWHEYFHF